MKKTVPLLCILVTLLIAGCNEKDLTHQIDGTWHLQKYAVNGVDQTTTFDTTHAGFEWQFSGSSGSSFSQYWQDIKVYNLYNLDTIAHIDPATHMLVIDSVTVTISHVPTSYGVTVQGDWYLTNGNQFLETRDPSGNKLYQIVDHSKSSLHLLYNNQDFYLSK